MSGKELRGRLNDLHRRAEFTFDTIIQMNMITWVAICALIILHGCSLLK